MTDESLTREQIEEALVASAALVDRYGEPMLAYFEFFERLYANALRAEDAIKRARAMARTGTLNADYYRHTYRAAAEEVSLKDKVREM